MEVADFLRLIKLSVLASKEHLILRGGTLGNYGAGDSWYRGTEVHYPLKWDKQSIGINTTIADINFNTQGMYSPPSRFSDYSSAVSLDAEAHTPPDPAFAIQTPIVSFPVKGGEPQKRQ